MALPTDEPHQTVPHAPPMPEPIPLGPRYRALRLLGQGGMGAVYEGFDADLARPVAIKVMLPAFACIPEARERFLREARAVARVTSDHVVTVHAVDVAAGVPFLVMELLQGQPLDAYLAAHPRPSFDEVRRIAREAALGLAAAHERGLVHRDIKPANLWIESPTGRVKILDFGLARGDKEPPLTRTGAVVGTPAFMSPEQAEGRAVDARSDLYSLGAVLYRLLAGHLPVVSTKPLDGVPSDLRALVLSLLERDPAARPASAAAVAARLAARPAPRWRAVALGTVLGAAAVALVAVLWRPPGPAPVPPPTPTRATFPASLDAAWTRKGAWIVEDGEFVGGGRAELRSPRPVGDFRLWFEAKGAAVLRFREADDTGLSLGDGALRRATAALTDAKDDARRAVRPGEWNTFELSAVGRRVTFKVNGVPSWQSYDASAEPSHLTWAVADGASLRLRDVALVNLGPPGTADVSRWTDPVPLGLRGDDAALDAGGHRVVYTAGHALYEAHRRGEAFSAARRLDELADGSLEFGRPFLTPDGLELWYNARPPGGAWAVWTARRASRSARWSAATRVGLEGAEGPALGPDGLMLYFIRAGRTGDRDAFVSRRPSKADPWMEAEELGPDLNTAADERWVRPLLDGLAFGRDVGAEVRWFVATPRRGAQWDAVAVFAGGTGPPGLTADGRAAVFASDGELRLVRRAGE